MGLFGKSDREKEQEEQARHEEARRKMEEARRRQQQAAGPAAGAASTTGPAASPAGPGGAQAKPAAVPAAQPAPQEETYTVVKGDSLSKIAKHHLGDANQWRRIYEANRQVIGDDPDKIKPGQQLRIPKGTAGGPRLA
jgi:nucleoid-associated protein YgaU